MSGTTPERNPGSFRDPGSRVYHSGEAIYRALNPEAARAFAVVRETGVLDQLMEAGWVVRTNPVNANVLGTVGQHAALVLQHEKVPFLSYPYEWSFAQLRAAALLHLRLHLRLLAHGITLSDATAYNVQFIGAKPVFIDVPSLRPYQEGEYWYGHRQFCEQFLNPLLLHALVGIPHNAWFRGNLEGVPLNELASLTPWRACLDWRFLFHVVLQNRLQTRAETRREVTAAGIHRRGLSRTAFVGLLRQLEGYIKKLVPRRSKVSTWGSYATNNTYETDEAEAKRKFVGGFVERVRPRLLLDLGCNTGDYSVVALQNGAAYAVGFDADQQALNTAFHRARTEHLPFLSLYQDLANPSPDQGWNQLERGGFGGRARGDALLALALVHHLAIARNIPLDQVVETLVRMSPRGVIEFVPKADPTVQTMLALREDIFPDYASDTFEGLLGQWTQIIEKQTISASGRTLYAYETLSR
jgi:ribosomal protein L11 methylase PrmA